MTKSHTVKHTLSTRQVLPNDVHSIHLQKDLKWYNVRANQQVVVKS